MCIFKRIATAFTAFAIAVSCFAVTSVSADAPSLEGYAVKAMSDTSAVTILGKSAQKTYAGQQCEVFTYGSSGFTANFKGTDFWVYVPDLPQENNAYKTQSVMVLVDTNMPMKATRVDFKEPGWHCLASNLSDGEHTIMLRKMSRGFYGIMQSEWMPLSHVATSGEFLTPNKRSELVIEVYGDSITNGDAVWKNADGSNSSYTYGSYSSVVGRLLDAEIRVTGNTGNGLLGWVFAQKNGQLDNLFPPQISWNKFDPHYDGSIDFSHEGSAAADVVIINLGTNDRGEFNNGDLTPERFAEEYLRFIKEIKTDCPEAIVIGIIGAMGGVNEFGNAIQGAVNDANTWKNEEFAYYFEIQNCSTIQGGLGYDNGHPSNLAHEVYGLQLATLINKALKLNRDLGDDIPAAAYEAKMGTAAPAGNIMNIITGKTDNLSRVEALVVNPPDRTPIPVESTPEVESEAENTNGSNSSLVTILIVVAAAVVVGGVGGAVIATLLKKKA